MSSNPHSSAFSPRAASRNPLHTRRGRAVAAGLAALVALPVLAACAAGNDPEVYNIKPDNGEGTAGYMWLTNNWVVADPNTGNAEVIGQIANTDPNTADSNQLTGVTVNGVSATVTEGVTATATTLAPGVTVDGGQVTIPGMASVQFGELGQPQIELPNADLSAGQNATVVYTFSNGQTASVVAQIQPNTGLWANYNPNGTSTATSLPTGGATGTASATAGTAVPSVSAGATTTATGTATYTSSATAASSATASASASHS